jgi:4-amino-4-deoxy-L-arabinose transferase-like glycosyltransferase
MPTASQQRRVFFLVVLIFAVIWFGNLQYRKLVHPDEGRYAEIPREMVATGNWLTPRLNGIKYFEKPPLQYWATAVSFSIFGEHEWTARLWSALTGFAGVLLVWFTGRRVFGGSAGNYAAMVLASAALYVGIGHINTLDMGVTLFMSAALSGFLIAQHESSSKTQERNWMLMAWATMALATLSKGLIGAALPFLTLIVYCAIQRDFSLWTRLHLKIGLPLFFAVAAPWFISVSLTNPEFAWFFFVQEHFSRFTTTIHHRTGAAWYFIPVLLVGLLPWTPVLFSAIRQGCKRISPPVRFDPWRFLISYIVVIFAFFSFSGSKLISYILPLFPAAALLTGWQLTQMRSRALAWQLMPACVVVWATGIYLWAGAPEFVTHQSPAEIYDAYLVWLQLAAAVLSAGLTYAVLSAFRNRTARAVMVTAAAGLVGMQLIITGYESLSPVMSSHDIAVRAAPYVKPGIPVYSIHGYDQTFPFYVRRTATLVEFKDEMEFGLRQQPQLAIDNLDAFEAQWKLPGDAVAIMPPDSFDLLASRGCAMEVIARNRRNVVVRKP